MARDSSCWRWMWKVSQKSDLWSGWDLSYLISGLDSFPHTKESGSLCPGSLDLPCLQCPCVISGSSESVKSGNHKLGKVGRETGGVWSNLLLQQGPPEQVTQDCVHIAFECLQWGTLHALSGQSSAWSLHRGEILPHVQMELLGHQFLPIPPVPFLGLREQSLT